MKTFPSIEALKTHASLSGWTIADETDSYARFWIHLEDICFHKTETGEWVEICASPDPMAIAVDIEELITAQSADVNYGHSVLKRLFRKHGARTVKLALGI